MLVEVGFLSNAVEARLLASGWFRGKLARAVADGILDYARPPKKDEGYLPGIEALLTAPVVTEETPAVAGALAALASGRSERVKRIRALVGHLDDADEGRRQLRENLDAVLGVFGTPEEPVPDALAAGKVRAVHTGVLWTLTLKTETPTEALETAREITITRARDRGLLANPHFQAVSIS